MLFKLQDSWIIDNIFIIYKSHEISEYFGGLTFNLVKLNLKKKKEKENVGFFFFFCYSCTFM